VPDAVYRMLTLLASLVLTLPVGTNLGMLHLLWMLVSGQLLATRGAVIPGLSACGLDARAVRRAWAALGQGEWTSAGLLAQWRALVAAEGRWQAHIHGGYHPVGVDVTGFWRPQLQQCPTRHYNAEAGKALPAIVVGLIGRVGNVGGQRLALPLEYVRADPTDPCSSTHERLLVRAAVAQCAEDDALVLDAGFGIALLHEEGATRFVVRCAKNSTFRRATPPAYRGRGRLPTRGVLVRPLARTFKDKTLAATPPDRTATWQDDGVDLRAEIWDDLVLSDAAAGSPSFTVVAVYDPRYRAPLLLASPLALPAQSVHALYQDRSRGGATALGRQADARCRPRLCPRSRNLPAVARSGPPRGGDPLLQCREQPGHPHRLLGSAPATDARPPAARARASSFSTRLPAPGATSQKSVHHGPSAHRLLGPAAPLRPCARGPQRTATTDTASGGRLS